MEQEMETVFINDQTTSESTTKEIISSMVDDDWIKSEDEESEVVCKFVASVS